MPITKEGYTPLDLAVGRRKNTSIEDLLRNYMDKA
jgi:hypothetical protein